MTTTDMVVASLILVAVFCIGILVGAYLNRMPSIGGGKHRLDNRPPALPLPATPPEEQPAKEYVDQQRPQSAWEQAVASWRATAAQPIDWGLTEEEKNRPLDSKIVEAYHDPMLQEKLRMDPDYLRKIRDHVDNNSTVEEMENGHWEGLSGTLELQQPTLDIHPLPAAGSALGSIHGPVRPVFGKTEHVRYDPNEYEGPLACNTCRTPLIKGQMFWSISLPEEGDDVILPICDPCEATTHA